MSTTAVFLPASRHANERNIAVAARLAVLLIVGAWAVAAVTGFGNGLLILNVVALAAIALGFKGHLVLFGVTILTVLDGVTRSIHMTGGLWRYNTFNYLLLGLIVLYHRHILRSIDLPSRFLIFFLVLLLLGLMVSSDVSSGVQHILNAVTVFGLIGVFRQAALDELLWFWMAALAGITAAGGCAVYFFGAGGRPEVNHNVFALFPLTALFAHCLAQSALHEDSRGAAMLMLLSTCNACWVFLSGSRGGLLTAVLCLLYLVVNAERKRQIVVYAVLGCILVSTLLTVSPSTTRFAVARVEKLLDQEQDLADRTSGRTELAAIGWSVFLDNPLGIGTGAFAKEFSTRNYQSKRFQAGTKRDAHSAWIKVLAENGLPGILVFTSFIASFAIIGSKSPRPSIRRIGLLTSAALAIAFLSSEFAAKTVWFLAAGCTFLLSRGLAPAASPAPGISGAFAPHYSNANRIY